ncbi:hypothetical protein CDL12_20493 [Handroanthus impetiginosus]|uniref:Uncharacterized protein n=1 Tax=Handroanthus impetiginosus TaxID=429701 RepID=A0A2G9GPL3_9LAMI|nr:hypothetical protein CDL12_20493 [Handroanthus impetiginosus]
MKDPKYYFYDHFCNYLHIMIYYAYPAHPVLLITLQGLNFSITKPNPRTKLILKFEDSFMEEIIAEMVNRGWM